MIIIKERREASVVALWTLCADHILLCLEKRFFFA